MSLRGDDGMERFEAAWKRVSARPPRGSGAAAAARAVDLARRRRAARTRWTWATAASALIVAGSWYGVARRAPAPPEAYAASPDLPSGTVLMWIDDETPLYLTFQAPERGGLVEGKP